MTGGLDGDLDTEALEVDHGCEDSDRREQVHDVGKMLSVECLTKGTSLVRPCHQQVDKSDDSSLKFLASASVDCSWRESFPDDRFANIGCNEEGDAGAETIALLQKLIEQNHHKPGNDQLDDQEQTDASSEVRRLAIQPGQDENAGLPE